MRINPESDPVCHQTFVLNLWRETPAAPWRAALRSINNQERIGFADLETLALFLIQLGDTYHVDTNHVDTNASHAVRAQSGDNS